MSKKADNDSDDFAKMLLNQDKRYQDAALRSLQKAARYLVRAHDLQRAVWVLELARGMVSDRIALVNGLMKQDKRERDFAREAADLTIAAWDWEGVPPEERAKRVAAFNAAVPVKAAEPHK